MKHYQKNEISRLATYGLCIFIIHTIGGNRAVEAMELNANLFSEAESTSNARLTSTNTKDDLILRAGLNVLLSEERKRFNANARFSLSQEFYLNNTFSDQTSLTTGFGLFNFDIVEDFLDWRTSFTRVDVLSDSALVNTPETREQRNVFRTGPSINYRINKTSILRLGSNYVQVENSSEAAADTKRLDANANYIFQYNSVTDFSLNSVFDRVLETKENGQTSSSSDEQPKNLRLSLGISRQISHGSVGLNIGRNYVHSDTNEKISGNFFDISFQRNEVLFHNIELQYSESISDTSIGFDTLELIQNQPEKSGLSSNNISSILDIVSRKQLDLSINRAYDSFQYTVTGFMAEDDYEIQLSDEKSIGLGVRLGYQLQEGLNVGFLTELEKNEFSDQNALGINTTSTYRIDSRYQLTKSFSINGNIGFERRGNNKLSSREYEDFSIGLGVNLSLL